MNKWREDTQPEWPEAAARTGELSTDGRTRDRRATQVFSGGDVRVTGARPSAGTDVTEILRGIPRQSEGEADSFAASSGTRSPVRDPWQEDADAVGHGLDSARHGPDSAGHGPDSAEHTHDPHEVTVQLDAVQLGDGFVRQVNEGAGAGPAADRPVFVDESGRRSRRLRRIGMAVAMACGVYAVVIVATVLSGNSNAPWLPVPGQQEGRPAGQVDTPSLPAESAPTGDTGVTAPGSAATTDEATAPSPGPSALEPAASAGPGRSGATAKPSPTATRTTPAAPGKGVTDPTPTQPSAPPSSPAPDPTPTIDPTPGPTQTTGTVDDGETGTVAEGPPEPQPTPEPPAA
ncbi:hypothetical protein STAFG_7596 [Streptomyces afghaniensis 772]|uniref:Uncharacterized protein n=1 Tax=Streptomyces afghaniensis 772 TaxID=1283301 RepID=S4MPJ3_9ACTN|nr:hypothetical protein [Streptomyces afghaniensis]EPJ35357.1 hypothetical protein STAFG_7596 [Streptomyces afghaniensis 772]